MSPNGHGSLAWPDPPAAGPLGDGRHALDRLRPETIEDLCAIVRDQVGQGRALYPQGGATAIDYGEPPSRPGTAIDTRALHQVIDYPHADMTITVNAGITAASLRTILAEKNQRLLIDVPQADRATLGGVFATAACGPRRFGMGRPRDQIIGISFVTSEGIEVKGGGRVVKNVAGYDFPKLLTGSMGTLGIITRMTLKVRPRPEASAIVWVPLPRPNGLEEILARLNTSDARPAAIEVLDGRAAGIIGGPLGLPGEDGDTVLAVGVEDNAESVRWQIDRLRSELKGLDAAVKSGDDAERAWTALADFQASSPGTLSATASMRPSAVASFLDQVDRGVWTFQTHAGNGVVHLHALGDPGLDAAEDQVGRLRGLAVGDGGSLVLTRCPAEWKAQLKVWGDPRPDWALASRVKQALDPLGVFNPGRFVGSL